jgi:hypothetical protein
MRPPILLFHRAVSERIHCPGKEHYRLSLQPEPRAGTT